MRYGLTCGLLRSAFERLRSKGVAVLASASIVAASAGTSAQSAHSVSQIPMLSIAARVAIQALAMPNNPSERSAEMSGASDQELTLWDLLSESQRAQLRNQIASRSIEKKLRAAALSHRPKLGEALNLAGDAVQAAFSQAGISVRVASRVQIVALAATHEKGLQHALKAQVEKACSPCIVTLTGLAIPAIDFNRLVTLNGLEQPQPLRGPFNHPIDVEFEDGTRKRLFISGRAEIDQHVLVSKAPVLAGESASASDVELALRRTTFSRNYLTDFKDLEGTVFTRALSPGDMIVKESLKKEIVVKNGESVRVRFVADAFEIYTDGVANGQGAVGDRLSVRVGSLEKVVTAVVRGRGHVEVQ